MARSLLDLLEQVVTLLEDLGVPYAVGGSIAGSYIGEPRATVDADVAVRMDSRALDGLLARVPPDLYVPLEAARQATREGTSFNLLDPARGWKVDLFVVGTGLLDRRQLDRAQLRPLPGKDREVRVTAAEDLVLRKLEWFRLTGSTSDRQWRDVIGILEVQGDGLDLADLRTAAEALGLADDLARALGEVGSGRSA